MTDPSSPPEEQEWPDLDLPRRTLLAAGLVGLAGCSGRGGEPDDPTPTQTEDSSMDYPDNSQTPTPDSNGDPPADQADDTPPGPRYASPGEVQETLDAAAGSTAQVALYPETVYRPSTTWSIDRGVTLDYNGATVEATGDFDLHDVHPGAQVLRPVVDLRGVPGQYNSSVFVFDSERYGFYGNNPLWHVRGGITRGRTGEGTVFEFVQGDENAIYFVHVDHAVWRTGTVVDMHRGDAFGINGVHVYGLWYGFETGIHMHNRGTPDRQVDNVSGNHFEVIAQPKDSEILWDMEVGRFNVLRGRLWDFGAYDDVIWRIHDGDVRRRMGNVLHWFPVGGTGEDLLQNRLANGAFDDRLGDPRNRVVIPWLQGHPASAFTG